MEAFKQMPNYVKFLKNVLTNRRKFEFEKFMVVALNEECSAILKNKIPLKKDPGSFTLPASIGEKELGRALCDLGGKHASIHFSLPFIENLKFLTQCWSFFPRTPP